MTSPTAPIQLRPVTGGDREFVERLYATTREDELRVVDWTDEQKQAFCHQQFEAQDHYYHEHFPDCSYQLILRGDERIGRLYLHRRQDEFRIVDIALLPEHRGHGIGRRLMETILAEAHGQGLPVRIHVEQFNPALRLYERLGFTRIGEVGASFLMECDRPT